MWADQYMSFMCSSMVLITPEDVGLKTRYHIHICAGTRIESWPNETSAASHAIL